MDIEKSYSKKESSMSVIYGDTDSCLIEYKKNIYDKFMEISNNTDNSIYNISKHFDKKGYDKDNKSTIKNPDIDLSKLMEDNTKSFSFKENSTLLGDKIMSLDLYKNICENTTPDRLNNKPKLNYDYY
ncbi:hypothetical protein PIROE2DRAFT_11966 [Piromyces sp. E2]|nr:hypothetical protein PIROE2DRAFT_11966 [Piromyces sp. E2]|eukprot:OUM61902.1 hypothetical protein PIROE2DRAFT_11966 [Piromyces sp. E2]